MGRNNVGGVWVGVKAKTLSKKQVGDLAARARAERRVPYLCGAPATGFLLGYVL